MKLPPLSTLTRYASLKAWQRPADEPAEPEAEFSPHVFTVAPPPRQQTYADLITVVDDERRDNRFL